MLAVEAAEPLDHPPRRSVRPTCVPHSPPAGRHSRGSPPGSRSATGARRSGGSRGRCAGDAPSARSRHPHAAVMRSIHASRPSGQPLATFSTSTPHSRRRSRVITVSLPKSMESSPVATHRSCVVPSLCSRMAKGASVAKARMSSRSRGRSRQPQGVQTWGECFEHHAQRRLHRLVPQTPSAPGQPEAHRRSCSARGHLQGRRMEFLSRSSNASPSRIIVHHHSRVWPRADSGIPRRAARRAHAPLTPGASRLHLHAEGT